MAANDLGRHKDEEEAGVAIVNKCIQEEVPQLMHRGCPPAGQSQAAPCHPAAAILYQGELKYIRQETGVNINLVAV